MNVCVLIPCYNEEAAIASVVRQLKAKGLPVVVVDDGSQDRSALVAKEAGAEVLVQEKNCGKGHALKTGIEYLLTFDYDGILMMDGDGQHAIEDVDVFLAKAQENPHCMINGNRMAHPDGMPRIRVWTNHFMSWIISRLIGCAVPDTQCGYRYVGMEILKRIKLESEHFEIETELLIKASRMRFDIVSVPVKTIYGKEKSSIRPVRDTFNFVRYYCKEFLS